MLAPAAGGVSFCRPDESITNGPTARFRKANPGSKFVSNAYTSRVCVRLAVDASAQTDQGYQEAINGIWSAGRRCNVEVFLASRAHHSYIVNTCLYCSGTLPESTFYCRERNRRKYSHSWKRRTVHTSHLRSETHRQEVDLSRRISYVHETRLG